MSEARKRLNKSKHGRVLQTCKIYSNNFEDELNKSRVNIKHIMKVNLRLQKEGLKKVKNYYLQKVTVDTDSDDGKFVKNRAGSEIKPEKLSKTFFESNNFHRTIQAGSTKQP